MTFSRGRQRGRLHKHARGNLAFAQSNRRCRADIYAGVRVTAAGSDTSDHNCLITAQALRQESLHPPV